MEKNIIQTALVLLMIVLAWIANSIREGKLLRYQELIAQVPADAEVRRRAQRDWHMWGLVVRLLIGLGAVPYLYDKPLLLIAYSHLAVLLCWVVYDGVLNQLNALPPTLNTFWKRWWYSGSIESHAGSTLEQKWGRILPQLKRIYTIYCILAIVAIVIYLVIRY